MECAGVFELMQQAMRTTIWAFVILGGIWLMRRGRGTRRSRSRPDAITRSVGLLNERYARGEIDRDEYLERKAYLE